MKIAIGHSRRDRRWMNREFTWEEFLARVSQTTRTAETVAEYRQLPKSAQDDLKDVGGFVGGELREGCRKKGYVLGRSLLTLDMDYAPVNAWELIDQRIPYTCCIYSTHKHTPENPRLRLIIPLSRMVSEQEYPVLARRVAQAVGQEYFDDTTYEASRLMYWPSTPSDGEFEFRHKEGELLVPEKFLKRHPETYPKTNAATYGASQNAGQDPSRPDELHRYLPVGQSQPESESESESLQAPPPDPQQDPLSKRGVLGAFCRAYPIDDALQTFLADIYEPSAVPGRYDYIPADSAAGLVLYEGKFAYSHHATDPAAGQLLNAFDLVRIHRFRQLDEGITEETPVTERPSQKAMKQLAVQDARVKLLLATERQAMADHDFKPQQESREPTVDEGAQDAPESDGCQIPIARAALSGTLETGNPEMRDPETGGSAPTALPDDWLTLLEYDNSGRLKNNLQNLRLILENDEDLQGIVFNQLSDGIEIRGRVPWQHPGKFWRDADDAQLISYIDSHYGAFNARNYEIMVAKVTDDRSYHPIRSYLDTLPVWDGIPRVDTLLIDYLGAEDSPFVRAVTRKTLCAAVARVQRPGCKFDSMLVLSGPQGVGKSTLIAKLGGEWFSDSLSLNDTKDKTAAEKLQGYWILEIGELAGLKKAEVETLRSFLSRQNDIYRASFGKRVIPHLRQCVFFGTTNAERGYLRDTTGNRRFWPVKTPGNGSKRSWDLTPELIRQIWAEVKIHVAAGEPLYLEQHLENSAREEQREAMESDDREGLVRDYLETLLPETWAQMDFYERREYLNGSEFGGPRREGTTRRTEVCNLEIWCECFGKERSALRRLDSQEITAIMAKIGGWTLADRKTRLPLYGTQWLNVLAGQALPDSTN